MERKFTLQDEVRRGNEAKMLIDHDLYKEAWQAYADALASKRRQIPMKDHDMHTRLILAEQVMYAVKGWFEDTVMTGKMADVQLKSEAEKKTLWKFGR